MVVGAKSQMDDRLTRTFSLPVASSLPLPSSSSSGLEGQGYLATRGGGVRGGEPLFRSIWQHQSLTGDQGFPSRTEIIGRFLKAFLVHYASKGQGLLGGGTVMYKRLNVIEQQ